MQKEPAAITATATAAVTAVIALLVAFGLDITDQQQNAILGVVAVLAPIVAGVIIRGQVFAPSTVERIKVDEFEAGQQAVTTPEPTLRPTMRTQVPKGAGVSRYTNVGH